ncbi:MAG: AIR synthase family protein [Lachnospiraceae bacterium]|nr:AIR synthase family protein [Lachnospiraceae bacterium]
MKIGKVPESVLKRSVFKQLKKNREEVLEGPAVGEDCAVLQLDEEMVVLSTDPVTDSSERAGTLAVHITTNNLVSSGADPVGVMLTILLPEKAKEKDLKRLMQEIQKECDRLGISVLGGHTETTSAVNRIVVIATGIGKAKRSEIITTSGAGPQEDILMTKYAAMEGTGLIAARREEELRTRYSKDFIQSAKDLLNHISVVKEAEIAREYNVSAMHDVKEGGIYGALWELAAASQVGLKVDLDAIPMKQETVEVCEFFDLNPYKLSSAGCMLMVTPRGRDLADVLNRAGIPTAIIGKTINEQSKIIIREGEEGFLEPPKSDELYKLSMSEE